MGGQCQSALSSLPPTLWASTCPALPCASEVDPQVTEQLGHGHSRPGVLGAPGLLQCVLLNKGSSLMSSVLYTVALPSAPEPESELGAVGMHPTFRAFGPQRGGPVSPRLWATVHLKQLIKVGSTYREPRLGHSKESWFAQPEGGS